MIREVGVSYTQTPEGRQRVQIDAEEELGHSEMRSEITETGLGRKVLVVERVFVAVEDTERAH